MGKYEKLSKKKYTGPARPKMVQRDANTGPSSRRLVEDDVFAKVDVRSRIQQIESKRPKPTLAPKDANPIPMPKPAMKYRPKEVSKYSVSRRLVEDEATVSDLIGFFERMNKPTLGPKDANTIPSNNSSSEEPPRPEHMPELVNRDANTNQS